MVASSLRKATRTRSSVAHRRSEQLPFYSGCLTRHMCEPARRMRPTTGDMPLIIEPPARRHATTISRRCQDYPTKPGQVESLTDATANPNRHLTRRSVVGVTGFEPAIQRVHTSSPIAKHEGLNSVM